MPTFTSALTGELSNDCVTPYIPLNNLVKVITTVTFITLTISTSLRHMSNQPIACGWRQQGPVQRSVGPSWVPYSCVEKMDEHYRSFNPLLRGISISSPFGSFKFFVQLLNNFLHLFIWRSRGCWCTELMRNCTDSYVSSYYRLSSATCTLSPPLMLSYLL